MNELGYTKCDAKGVPLLIQDCYTVSYLGEYETRILFFNGVKLTLISDMILFATGKKYVEEITEYDIEKVISLDSTLWEVVKEQYEELTGEKKMKDTSQELKEKDILFHEAMNLLSCDNVRICQPLHTMYLIVGYERKSEGWVNQDDEPQEFDYLAEQVIASGDTYETLHESLLEYCRVKDMTMDHYMIDQIQKESNRG